MRTLFLLLCLLLPASAIAQPLPPGPPPGVEDADPVYLPLIEVDLCAVTQTTSGWDLDVIWHCIPDGVMRVDLWLLVPQPDGTWQWKEWPVTWDNSVTVSEEVYYQQTEPLNFFDPSQQAVDGILHLYWSNGDWCDSASFRAFEWSF